jgi:hypothetical protein
MGSYPNLGIQNLTVVYQDIQINGPRRVLVECSHAAHFDLDPSQYKAFQQCGGKLSTNENHGIEKPRANGANGWCFPNVGESLDMPKTL